MKDFVLLPKLLILSGKYENTILAVYLFICDADYSAFHQKQTRLLT